MSRGSSSRGARSADRRWTLVACILASSLSFVDGSVLNVALPAIRASYATGAQDVQWVVNAYLLPLSSLLLLGGALGDHFGRRRLLLFGTSLFGASSLACALAPGLPLLLAARGVQGIGAALLLPNSLALLNAAYSGEKRGRAVGIWAAAGAATAAVAPLLGGWLVGTVGWPAIFYINLPLALGAILLALKFVEESRERGAGRTDYAGALLVTAALGGLTYALTLWSASSRLTATAAIALIGGVVLLAVFLAVERHRRNRAMLPLAMFANRCFSGLNLLTFLLYGAFGAAMLLIPYVLIAAGGYSPVRAGLAMLPMPILMTALSPAMGSLAARIGPRLPLAVGPVVVGAGLAMSRLITPETGYWNGPFPAILVMAAGMTIAVAPLTASVLGSVEEEHVATASGLNSAVARLGGLVATALLGSVLGESGNSLFGGFHGAMTVAGAVSALGGLVALTMLGGIRMKISG
ncbi:DHA2 family efflux MFS transporter permease subunit [Sphingomonas sp.]|uniref:DHA2 family efflux MFS transporter permease subunit n=1 Tax=Sphingomonas sp. TaxID=28214 RepID=UPI002600EAAB|nr:DHA2 family efflux MFS transporter permease subunit [Sphingomonas sp.]MBV9527776.1 DHA2 family efflux MFS transporter permease subunit [Sphingomonas sp.]